jgi:hypothetical protein
MTAQKTINRLTGPKTGSFTNQHRTTCKLCPHSIHVDDAAVWLTKPMGLSHDTCARQAGLAPRPR